MLESRGKMPLPRELAIHTLITDSVPEIRGSGFASTELVAGQPRMIRSAFVSNCVLLSEKIYGFKTASSF